MRDVYRHDKFDFTDHNARAARKAAREVQQTTMAQRAGCTNELTCHSTTIHEVGCPGLQKQLDEFKKNREEYYANGGYHGRG